MFAEGRLEYVTLDAPTSQRKKTLEHWKLLIQQTYVATVDKYSAAFL